jgi:hypothetical protein
MHTAPSCCGDGEGKGPEGLTRSWRRPQCPRFPRLDATAGGEVQLRRHACGGLPARARRHRRLVTTHLRSPLPRCASTPAALASRTWTTPVRVSAATATTSSATGHLRTSRGWSLQDQPVHVWQLADIRALCRLGFHPSAPFLVLGPIAHAGVGVSVCAFEKRFQDRRVRRPPWSCPPRTTPARSTRTGWVYVRPSASLVRSVRIVL